jgi:hypothetical protein
MAATRAGQRLVLTYSAESPRMLKMPLQCNMFFEAIIEEEVV